MCSLLMCRCKLLIQRLNLGNNFVSLALLGALCRFQFPQGGGGGLRCGLRGGGGLEQGSDSEDRSQVILQLEFAVRGLELPTVNHERKLTQNAHIGAGLRCEKFVELVLCRDGCLAGPRAQIHSAPPVEAGSMLSVAPSQQ